MGSKIHPTINWVCCITQLLIFLSACSPPQQKQNRLQFASSPYLKEHADNPVDWYEWGDEALDRAKKENKPLLVSIGYAACHWCHEMEKECFMDTAVASLMNENFVCIKVDREERPDIDGVYMKALQLLSGDTGWPLNSFALPDGKPFFAGTYYTKNKWIALLTTIARSYHNSNKLIVTQANALRNGIAYEQLQLLDTNFSTEVSNYSFYPNLYDSIARSADLLNGGLKGNQKFPTPAFTEFMLQHAYITGSKEAVHAASTTLTRMATGGIYDHVGGGFYRYTTDSAWRMPHFEKMLYDNGQLISLYAHAFAFTKTAFYRTVLTETINFVENELAASTGGYYSSLNADTDAGEGAYYLWRKQDFLDAVEEDSVIATYFHVTEQSKRSAAGDILYTGKTPAEFAAANNLELKKFELRLVSAKNNLLTERRKRPKPSVDTKIITAWNAMLLKGYADAYAATGTEHYLDKARSCAIFIEQNMLSSDGQLKRIFKDQKVSINGFLDDYAWTASALERLYEVSLEDHWLRVSRKLTDFAIKTFFDERTGLFYYSPGTASELTKRILEVSDADMPSSNAVMAEVINKLGRIYDDSAYNSLSKKMIASVTGRMRKMPRYHIEWSIFAGKLAARSYDIAIVGDSEQNKNKEFQRAYLPTCVVMGSVRKENLPLLRNKYIAGKTVIYVCTNRLCKRPVENTDSALAQIK